MGPPGPDIEKGREGLNVTHFEVRGDNSPSSLSSSSQNGTLDRRDEEDESGLHSQSRSQSCPYLDTHTHMNGHTHGHEHTHTRIQSPSRSSNPKLPPKFHLLFKLLRQFSKYIQAIKSLEETRGVDPIPLDERLVDNSNNNTNNGTTSNNDRKIPFQMMLLWFSMTLATNNIIIGSLGTLVFRLGFSDAALCAFFGTVLGAVGVGYMSIWGPRSGSRTLIVTRFFMGYYPSKICALLNILTNLGYSMLNCVVGGQLLSKVSGGNVSVVIGIILVAAASWVLATFGIRLFQFYERYSWLPQIIVMSIITGSSVSLFDFQTPQQPPSQNPSESPIHAKRLTFLSLCLSASLAWAPIAADYYVYYPPTIKPSKTFLMTLLGQTTAMTATLTLGIGLGTVISSNETWKANYDSTPGSLLMAAYNSLGNIVGKFCAILNVVGVISNNAPGAYSMGLNFQMLGRWWVRVPRGVFAFATTVVYTSCALGGRDVLYDVFKNFLPLIGYWVVGWMVVVVEEDLLRSWRRQRSRRGYNYDHHDGEDAHEDAHGGNEEDDYDWSTWNQKDKLPPGIAATLAFLVGCVGAIVGMDQIYYTGPIARSIPGGCDLGIWLSAAFTAVAFPPLRVVEGRVLGR